MEVKLTKKPKQATLIEGFPGFGLIGTIVTEHLMGNLKCEKIGEFMYDELPATIAIHKGKIIHPMSIYYNEKYNVIILHAILDIKGKEWMVADAVKQIVDELDVKEVISIEGVASQGSEDIYCFNSKDLEKQGAKPIEESVIMGVTAAFLIRNLPVKCLFAETHSGMPDSSAAAKILEHLDKYIGFKLDTEPLYEQAKVFENKLSDIMQSTKKTESEAEKKQMSYLG
ncbi:MAG: proteasome assembly chaperone family protein [Nanoarchaeota archaeon]